MNNQVFNRDCLEAMLEYPDNAFDLAVVDPPYGAGFTEGGGCQGWFAKYHQEDDSQIVNVERERERENAPAMEPVRRKVRQIQNARHGQGKNVRQPDGTWGFAKWRNGGDEEQKKIIAWDVAPGQDYFDELFRVSRDQIIWGGNYFSLPPTRCFLVWRKLTISESFSMAMAEYAWTSFNGNAKVFEHTPQGKAGERFHPTQKPVALYAWIFKNYAKPGMKILDTHLGSGSSRIAAWDAGLDFVGYEIDKTYFDLQEERFQAHIAQGNLFLMGNDTDV